MKKIKIEVCVDSVESAIAAIQGGATRLEICGNLILGGGTTPSSGLVHQIIKQSCPQDGSTSIELMIMIRPRTGDFIYTTHEISVMLQDIKTFSDLGLGVTGVVFGALSTDGSVDVVNTTVLVKEAVKCGLQVCFHRAFDMAIDQSKALSTLQEIPGITRILTSGGKPSVLSDLPHLISLYNQSQHYSDNHDRIEIMPGSGINKETVIPILRALLPYKSFNSIHLSGGGFVDSAMQYRPEGMGMGASGAGEWGIWRTSEGSVRAVREIVDRESEMFES